MLPDLVLVLVLRVLWFECAFMHVHLFLFTFALALTRVDKDVHVTGAWVYINITLRHCPCQPSRHSTNRVGTYEVVTLARRSCAILCSVALADAICKKMCENEKSRS